jgi:hypothetical protein
MGVAGVKLKRVTLLLPEAVAKRLKRLCREAAKGELTKPTMGRIICDALLALPRRRGMQRSGCSEEE